MKPQMLHKTNQLINKFDITQMSVSDIKNTMQLQKILNTKFEGFLELQKKIFESYDIQPNEQGSYSWDGHEDAAVISTKMNELINMDIEIPTESTHYMSEDEFIKLARTNMSLEEITILSDLIVK
jgi:hypothetical protein